MQSRPCLEAPFHCRLRPPGLQVSGRGGEGLQRDHQGQRTTVVHLLHSCLKATFRGGRGLQETQPPGLAVKPGPSTWLQSNVLVALCDPLDCSPPGSSVHGISQARILEWVAISSSRESSPPRDQTQISCTSGRFFTV